jgi:hypothetical protein
MLGGGDYAGYLGEILAYGQAAVTDAVSNVMEGVVYTRPRRTRKPPVRYGSE